MSNEINSDESLVRQDAEEGEELIPLQNEQLRSQHVSLESSVLSLDDSRSRRRCMKNMFLHCVSVMLIFTSYMSLQDLESTINSTSGVGVLSMACVYGGLIIACIFSPTVVKYTGYKWAMVICFGVHCLFAGANFYPKIYILAPVCALLGLASGPFWAGQGQFVTTVAVKYGEYTETNPEVSISRFNGLFFMFLQSSQIWGNMISSLVLTHIDPEDRNVTYLVNETCGAKFHSYQNGSSIIPTRAHMPTQNELHILIGTYLACCVAGFLITVLFVDNIEPLPETDLKPLSVRHTLGATLWMHCDGIMLLLLPILFFNGVEQVFLFGDFTEAFVACELGVGYIGYAMITFGAVSTLSSFAMGQLEMCTGRMLLFIVAGIIDLGLLMVMLEWNPGDGRKDNWLLYFIPGLWGIADSIWQTTTVSMLAVEFGHVREAAFSTFRLWQGAGMGVAFAYSFYAAMRIKIFVVIALLLFSMGMYLLMELVIKRNLKKPYIDLYAPIIE